MGIRYEWADDNQIIMNIYIESPWSWQEYNALTEELMQQLADYGKPCATVVDATNMGSLPRDGSVIQILMNVDKMMPENLFASAIVGGNYGVRVFMNVLTRLRPHAQRIALFTVSIEDAHEKIMARYTEQFPELSNKSSTASVE